MPDDADAQPFVPGDAAGETVGALERILQTVAPDTYVAGGASEDATRPQTRPRNYDTLKERERIYKAGGPITDFIDTRALMTYGTGVEFSTEEDEITDSEGRTVAEWLHDQFPLIDQTMIERGVHTYVYGDGWPELVETRGGGVSHINLVHPTTVDPSWNIHGEIEDMRQVVKGPRGSWQEKPLDDDTVGHWFYKCVSSGPLGDSLLEQNRQEVEWYWENQTQRANAIELHGSPKYHVQVGSDGQSIPDRLIRRVRDQFRSDRTDEKTNWTTGGDIEISELDAPGFEGMDSITETDVTKLASGFGVPLEWTNFGSAGLGDGTPAESRIKKFERQARAEQKRAAEQIREFPMRMIVDDYSPFPPGTSFEVAFGDVISDPGAIAEWLQQFTEFYTRDEIRQKFGDEALTDEQEQAIEDRVESGGDGLGGEGGGGGFFSERAPADAPDPLRGDDVAKRAHADGGTAAEGGTDFRARGRRLDSVPDDAVSISDPSEAPDDASIIRGDRGGLYYVPGGGGGGEGAGGGEALGDIREGDPPPSVNLENEVDAQSLDDAGIDSGSNHADMRIAQLEDGSEVFVRENVDDFTAGRIAGGYSVYEQLDVPIPDQHIDDDGTLAKEAIDGNTLRQGVDTEIDEESLIDAYAASIVTGDTDMHGGNMIVRDDGTVMPVDIAGSGGPVDDASDKEAKVTNYLDMLDADVEFDQIAERAEEMAAELDTDALPDTPATDNIASNAEALA